MTDRDTASARLELLLGVGQIISWGTLIYGIAILGEPLTAALGIERGTLFAAFSIGLGASGIAAPAVGRWIDRAGGRPAMSLGSVFAMVAFTMLALATHAWVVFMAWVIGGVAMSMCLYDAAFATLARALTGNHRRAVTALTLLGAIASTVFWPLTQWWLDRYGFRLTFGAYAALHATVGLPIHWWAIPAPVRLPPRAFSDAHGALTTLGEREIGRAHV